MGSNPFKKKKPKIPKPPAVPREAQVMGAGTEKAQAYERRQSNNQQISSSLSQMSPLGMAGSDSLSTATSQMMKGNPIKKNR